MSKFRKKPVVIEATQWFQNGDHPLDECRVTYLDTYGSLKTEGKIVRYFRHPGRSGDQICTHCDRTMRVHGWIDTLEGGHIVCPADWVITGVKGEHYPCKPDIFAQTCEPVLPESGGVRNQLSRKQVLEIQEEAEQATPGTWSLLRPNTNAAGYVVMRIRSNETMGMVGAVYGGDTFSEPRANGKFITTARTNVPALTRQLDQAMESCEYIYQGHLDHVSPCSCVHCKRYRAYYGDEGGSND